MCVKFVHVTNSTNHYATLGDSSKPVSEKKAAQHQGYDGADEAEDYADAGGCKEHETESPEAVQKHHAATDRCHLRVM